MSSSKSAMKRILSTLLVATMVIQLVPPPQAEAINSVLDLNKTFPYLINNKTGQVIEPRDYMDFENIYVPNATYKALQTAQGRNYHLIKAFDFANYFQSDYWHYSSEQDLRLSAQPVANESKCGQQLNWFESQLNKTNSLWSAGEQHVNLMTLVDAWGKPEATTYLGHAYWFGSYYECLRNSIDMDQYEYEECSKTNSCSAQLVQQMINRTSTQTTTTTANNKRQQQQLQQKANNNNRNGARVLKSRYCIGKVRDVDWPNKNDDNYTPGISYKVGLCIPETCETLSIRQHRDQLERLMRFNLPEYMRTRMNLVDMYCVPDERSPIRQLKPSSRIFLGVCITWLALLIGATAIFSCYKRHQQDIRTIIKAEQTHRDLELSQCHQEQQLLNNHHHDPAHHCIIEQSQLNHLHHSSSPHINYMLSTSPQSTFVELQQAVSIDEKPNNNMNNNGNIKNSNQIKDLLAISTQLLMLKTRASLGALTGRNGSNNEVDDIDTTHPKLRAEQNNQQELQDNQPEDAETKSTITNSSYNSSSIANWLSESPMTIKILQALSITENLSEFQQPPAMLRVADAARLLRVNLNALDSIKCLCCLMVIFGHIVFIHMQHLSNVTHTIELSNQLAPRVLIAFFNFVDTFFIISGMLTAYFIFKRFNKTTFSNPMVWVYISLLRLLRLSPVYVLVFWFSKTVSVYMSDGPVWDYGTDDNSNKGLCINDHWWKSLLYLGNYGTMQPLCILPSWSIIVDSQYSLLVPPILYLIFRHQRTGYIALLLAVIVSTANMSWMLASQTAVKNSDMAKIRLHVYPLISRFAAEFYNTAWNRIGPVAIGILGGHLLYLYDIGSIRRWPWFMRGVAFKFILFLHLFIFLLPTVGRFTDDPSTTTTQDESDMTIFVLSNATIKPIWSIINTIFLLRLVTDLRLHSVFARLMSHNLWHCLGKLCFASYLIHYEIILVLLKSRQEGLVDPDWLNVLREFSTAFIISTVISYFIYILYESPINKLITLFSVKTNKKA